MTYLYCAYFQLRSKLRGEASFRMADFVKPLANGKQLPHQAAEGVKLAAGKMGRAHF